MLLILHKEDCLSIVAMIVEEFSADLCAHFSSSIQPLRGFLWLLLELTRSIIVILLFVTLFVPCDGKRDFRADDLRDKLDRRQSPRRTFSPRRDGRGKRSFHESSPTRSLEKSRKHRKRQQLDDQSDFSGSLRISDDPEDQVRDRITSDARLVLEKQLKIVQSDINLLDHRKSQLRVLIEGKADEAVSITSRIQELNAQLSKETEDCRRIHSRIKKFVKAHRTCARVEDELKRSQVRLQKLGEHLISDNAASGGNEENSIMNAVNDGQVSGFYAINQHNGGPSSTFFGTKMLHVEDTAERLTHASLRAGDKYRDDSVRLSQLPGGNAHAAQPIDDREIEVENHSGSRQLLGNRGKQKRGKPSSLSNPHADKQLKGSRSGALLPATSMAAHATDELVENEEVVEVVDASAAPPKGGAAAHQITRSQVVLPPPLPVSKNSYSQYKGDDENIDVEAVDDMVDVDIV